jgi:zinc/manganese transport system substrate-binding protein
MKRFFLILTLVIMAVVSRAAEKLEVVATLPDLAVVAMQVGGPFINLNTLANPSEDPHFVDPKPSFAKLLNKADLLIEGGADLEVGWLPPLVQNARNPKILPGQPGRFVASEGVPLKDRPTGPVDRSQGDVHPNGNPHYLMDPSNAPIVAKNLAERLAKLDPDNAQMYKQNAEAFREEILARTEIWKQMMEPFKGAKVITYHRSFNYFLDRFGLELFDTLEPKPGIEPSPSHIADLIKKGKEAGIKYILIEDNRPKKTADKVASEIGAKVVVLRHMPDTTKQARYTSWIRGMVEAMEKANKTK